MTSHKADKIFFSISIVLVLLFSVVLYLDFTKDYSAIRTKEIGFIEFKKNTAERKYTSQVLWGKVEDKSPIYNFDTIRTSEDSEAAVTLDNGIEVSLNSNTLVLFSMKDDSTDIDMQSGGIGINTENAVVNEDNKPNLIITSSGATFESSEKGDFALSKNEDGEIEADAYSGELQMTSEEEVLSVKKGFRLFLDKNGKGKTEKVAYTISSPPNTSIFVREVTPAPISFSWEGTSSEKTKLIISPSRSFSGQIITIPVEGNSIQAEIPPGSYFWKIESENGTSAPARFTILNDINSTPIFPKQDEAFAFHKTSPVIRFKWIKSNYASGYKVEIFKDAELTDLVEELPSDSTTISFDGFTPGRYFWRVKNLYGKGLNTDNFLCDARSFIVEKQTKISKPIIPKDSQKNIISLVAIRENGGILRWDPVNSADSYNVEISKDTNFNEVVISKTVRNNFFALPEDMETGDYFWRVSVNIEEEISDASNTAIFSVVEKKEMQTLFPPPNSYFSPTSPELRMTWRDENFGEKYKVEVSKNKNFINPVVSEIVSKQRVSLKILPPGNYFWRISLLNNKEKTEQRSNTSSFTVFKIDKNMKLRSPEAKEKLDIVKLDDIAFEWSQSLLAEAYSFAVYNQLLNSRNIVYEAILPTNQISLTDLTLFRELDYQWEVTGMRKQEGEWVAVTDTKISQFTVFLSKRVFVPGSLNFGTAGADSQNIMGDDPILFVIPEQ